MWKLRLELSSSGALNRRPIRFYTIIMLVAIDPKLQLAIHVPTKVNGENKTFFVALVAVKGDWPFLRKAMHLRVGFTSKRKCHLCPGSVSSRTQ